MNDKWPGQEDTTSFGMPPAGMWYDPTTKESAAATKTSLGEALKHFITNQNVLGLPTHVSMSEQKVYFNNGKALSFDEVLKQHQAATTDKDASFFDGPVDIGKEHDGDFPSVTWMPRGHEDEDVSDQDMDVTAAMTLNPQLLHQAIVNYVQDHTNDIDWWDRYADKYVDYIRGEAEDAGKSLSSNVINNILEETDTEQLAELFFDDEVSSWEGTLEGITTEEDLRDTYPQILDEYVKLKPKPSVGFEYHSALEPQIPEDQKEQIAAQYGPEYLSALARYDEAIKNQHPKDRAVAYAVEELKKQGITISAQILSEIADTYTA